MPLKNEIKNILKDTSENKITSDEALEKLAMLPFEPLINSNYDWHRPLRNGFLEVIYGEGKSIEDLKELVINIKDKKQNILVTRADEEKGEELKKILPSGNYHKVSKTFCMRENSPKFLDGLSILCGGTADLPVAEEARITSWFFGAEPTCIYDIGVAGLPRLLSRLPEIRESKVLIVIAGLEGALPSVIGGLVDAPVIAVPTSVGYGTANGGKTALFAMLNSCSEGIAVTNIDNGFGAACAAMRILKKIT